MTPSRPKAVRLATVAGALTLFALAAALISVAGRASPDDLRQLLPWTKHACRHGDSRPGIALADVLDVQLRIIRRGRCPVSYGS